jgi:hypothetical protein
MQTGQLAFEDFADKEGHTFTLDEPGLPAIPLLLQHAKLLNPAWAPPGVRPPFALTFVTRDPRILPQGLYRLTHERSGEVSIFLVPSGKDAEGVTYHATFN